MSQGKVLHSQVSRPGEFFDSEPGRQVHWHRGNASPLQHDCHQVFSGINIFHRIEESITKWHVQ